MSLATIYSVTWDFRTGHVGARFWAQAYAVPVAFGVLAVCLAIDYRTLAQQSLWLYAALIAALVAVGMVGVVGGGARRWISFAGFNLQPSEFARITVALVLAMFFGDNRRAARSMGELVLSGLIVGLPMLLILKQPDLGT